MGDFQKYDAPTSEFDRAVSYPNVGALDFVDSYMLSVSREDIANARPEKIIDQAGFAYVETGKTVRLNGSDVDVPTYDVSFETKDGEEIILRDRVSLAAIGSNSSPHILRLKFKDFATDDMAPEDTQIPVMQAKLENHAIVEAAFVSGTGAVPVTIHRHEESSAAITVGFLTKAQAEQLTGTEPNYEGVMIDTDARFENGATIHNPIAYVSIWGALTKDGQNPIANASIPQDTPLERMDTTQALMFVSHITDPENTDFWGYVAGHMENSKEIDADTKAQRHATRLERSRKLQNHALPTNVIGTRVFGSTISKDPVAAEFAPHPEYQREPELENEVLEY